MNARRDKDGAAPLGAKVAFFTVLGLCVLVGAAWVAAHVYAGDKAPRSAEVEGISIAGLTQDAAMTKLRAGLQRRALEPIVVTYGDGRTRAVKPASAGLKVDYAASVREAGGGSGWGVRRLWEVVTGGGNHRAQVTVDDHRMQATLDELSEGIGRRPVNGTLAFRDGRPFIVPGRSGVVVSRSMAESLLERRFLRTGSQKLPTEVQAPAISPAELKRAYDQFGRPAMSAPVTLFLGGQRVVAPPRLFGKALTMVADGDRLVPQVDGDVLLDALDPVMPTVGREPRDASVVLRRGRPVVVPARIGVTFEGDQVEAGFARAAVERGSARRLVVRGRAKQPELTTAEARALHVSQRVASFTASYPAARHLDVNLGLATRAVDGTLLRPGQTFSFNGVVGERTRAAGYLDDGAGGPVGAGLSRLAGTAFNAMLQGGLAETGRTPTTVRDARFPVGREVVVGWPADDLRFRNDTRDGVLVTALVRRSVRGRAGSVTVELWSTRSTKVTLRTGPRTDVVASRVRVVQRRGCRPVTGAAGYGIDVERVVRSLSGKVLHRDTFHTDYAATDTVRCRKAPKRRGR